MKYLITNADDFGWGADITRGIIDAHTKGVLSSASVIINETDDESILLAQQTPTLGLGIHLNIATGEPTTARWRQKYGVFKHPLRSSLTAPYSQSMWDQMYGKIDPQLIYEEFESQVHLFREKLGKLPDHMDTHYNTYSVPNVFDAYLKLAHTHALPVRQPVSYVGDRGTEDFSHSTSELEINLTLLTKLRKENIKTTTKFSLEYINLHEDYIKAIKNELETINEGESIEISFHPGYREDWRRKQVEILVDPLLKRTLEELNVKVINYLELL